MNKPLVLLAALVLTGCVTEKVPAPKIALPATYETPATAGAAAPALDLWWRLYHDPQLTGLVEQALAAAPDARIAMDHLREAAAVRSSALYQYGLTGDLNATGSDTYNRTLAGTVFDIPGISTSSGTEIVAEPTLAVSWEVDLFGRKAAARRSANADLGAARFDAAASRMSLAAQVADQLFAARGLAAQLEDADETARIDDELAEAARARFGGGVVGNSDVDQTAAQAEQARAQVADLEGQLQAARRTLLVLVGRGGDPSTGLPITPDFAEPVTPPKTLPGALLGRRPDVAEDREKLVSALGALKVDELALLPTVDLTPEAVLTQLNQTGFSETAASLSAGASLFAPIFSRSKLIAEIHAQGARADEAVATYEKQVYTAYGEAENALAQSAKDRVRVAELTQAEASARHAFEASSARYRAGVDALTDVLSTEQTWRRAHTSLTNAKTDALRRSVTLFKALGGGWTAT